MISNIELCDGEAVWCNGICWRRSMYLFIYIYIYLLFIIRLIYIFENLENNKKNLRWKTHLYIFIRLIIILLKFNMTITLNSSVRHLRPSPATSWRGLSWEQEPTTQMYDGMIILPVGAVHWAVWYSSYNLSGKVGLLVVADELITPTVVKPVVKQAC